MFQAIDNVDRLYAYDKETSEAFEEAIAEIEDPEGITQVIVAELEDGEVKEFFLYGEKGDAWQIS